DSALAALFPTGTPSLSRCGRSGCASVPPHLHISTPQSLHARLELPAEYPGKGAFFAAAGDARISAVDARDLADVAVAALTTSQHDNKIYALTGPDALTFAEMAHQLSRAIGRTITFVDVPPESMREALADLG